MRLLFRRLRPGWIVFVVCVVCVAAVLGLTHLQLSWLPNDKLLHFSVFLLLAIGCFHAFAYENLSAVSLSGFLSRFRVGSGVYFLQSFNFRRIDTNMQATAPLSREDMLEILVEKASREEEQEDVRERSQKMEERVLFELAIWSMFVASALILVSILSEFVQSCLPYKIFDWGDVMANIIGTLLGVSLSATRRAVNLFSSRPKYSPMLSA